MSVEIDLSLPVRSEFCVVSRRNDSLGSRARWTLFAGLCAVSMGMALTFAAFGAWPVLPYSMIEMGLLCWAFRWIERHAKDWERVTVRGDRIVVERNSGGTRTQREFNRFWTRLEVEADARSRVARLVLRHRGESLPFGEGLPQHERAAIARELRRALAAGNAR
ncbi:MAG TPA: DUF2244 domain-containing protein [Casimicrobiaceae bacterium]|jgi:uncharacterized membrane protein|nr:DUF2244 domain-containing protein [Casimicrobiaceae bacterium]